MKHLTVFFLFILMARVNSQTIPSNPQTVAPDYNYISVLVSDPTVNWQGTYAMNDNGVIYQTPTSGSGTSNKVAKYLPTGLPDTTFGVNGVVTFPEPRFIKEITDQNLYFVTEARNIVKCTLGGVTDTSFGNNGFSDIVVALGVGSIGNLYVNNDQSIYATIYDNYLFKKIVKLLPTGAIDPTFTFDSVNNLSSFHVIDENTFFTTYSLNNNTFYINKYKNGVLDNTFGNQGELVLPYSPEIKFLFMNNAHDFHIVHSRVTSNTTTNVTSFKMTKYKENGVIDATFGNNGTADISYNIKTMRVSNINFDVDNKLVLFGSAFDGSAYFLARLNTDGSLDNNFNGSDAYYMTPLGVASAAGGRLINTNSGNTNILQEYLLFTTTRASLSYRRTHTMKFKKTITLSTAEADHKQNVGIYPNPIEDILHIKLEFREKLQKVSVYSMDGRLVFTGTDEKINLGTLSSGNYLVEIKTNKNTYSKKVIKK
ncbi:T9SS type A sorting domain-containing protein [Chryseobacterium joostei]|uniref:T9SS type A sorting domain-containing protein n=1 Tax=Chryseobacterium joostei TaxID=112234 RepID=UPI003D103143